MKKEIVLAIVIGLALGLLITYGVYLTRQALTKNPSQTNLSASPSPTPESSLSTLVINSPADESIQTKKEVIISGTTLPKSYVVIFINDQENITTADDSGNFSISTDLESGSNIISIHALDENGQETTAQRTVIFTTQDLNVEGGTPQASPAMTPSPSPKASVKPTTTPKPVTSPKPSASPTAR